MLRLSLSRPLETESTEIVSTKTECAGNESAVSNLIESALSEWFVQKLHFRIFQFLFSKE